MLSNYNSFVEDFILESLINETYLYFVKDFKDSLYKISTKSQIAKDLIDAEYRDVKPDMTFISLSDKEGYVSFTTLRNLKRNIEKSFAEWAKGQNLDDERVKKVLDTMLDKIEKGETSQSDVNFMFKEYDLGTKSRNDSKIGRLVNSLLPGKYSDKEIEEFVNLFKASKEISGERFEIVSGKDIEFWYNNQNYAEMTGTLGNSCMAQKRNIFNIYVNNPDVCRLLVLLNEDNKLIGRALIWKLEKMNIVKDEDPGFFMDRQYTIKDSDVEKFRDYAKKEGWSYKSYNNHHSFGTVNYKGEDRNVDMVIQVGRIGGDYDYSRYPYMDTFRRYDPRIGKLYNDDDQESEQEGCYILEDTGGGYSEVEGGVWSEWHDRMIPEDEAVYSDPYGDHLLRDYAVRVDVGSSRRRGWYHQDDDDIVYDEYSDEYVHVDDAVYSEIYGNYLWDERAVRTITDIYSDGDVENPDGNWCYMNDRDIVRLREMRNMLWYKKLCDKYSDWDEYEYIQKELLTKNYEDEYIPKILERTIYKVGEPKSSDSPDIFGVEWLLEQDAIVLDYEINMDNSRVIDIIQYNDNVDEILENVLDKLRTKIKQLDDIINNDGQTRMKFDDDEEYRKGIHELRTKLNLRFRELDSEEWHNL
jgi:hypothetical protein